MGGPKSGDRTTMGLIAPGYTSRVYPYATGAHLRLVVQMMQRSDAHAQLLGAREGIRQARRARRFRFIMRPVETVYEVGPDGVAREVRSDAQRAELPRPASFRTGVAIGLAATLAVGLVRYLRRGETRERERLF